LNNTRKIGIGIIIIGIMTSSRFPNQNIKSVGIMLAGMGFFLLWNGFVSEYNQDPSFAIFG